MVTKNSIFYDYSPDVKKLAEEQQVHHHKNASDPCFGGLDCPGPEIIEPVAVLALAELAFNGDSLASILFPLRPLPS
jgi:hypothetical protein